MNHKINKPLDFYEDNVKLVPGMAAMLFRGVQASILSGICINRTNGAILDYAIGEMVAYVQGQSNRFDLKAIITVLGGSCNSPDRQGKYQGSFLFSYFGGQNRLVSGSIITASDLFVLTNKQGEIVMIAYKKLNQDKSHFRKLNFKLTTLILAGLTLTSCGREEPDRTTVSGRAKYDASMIKHEVHADYLNCYPLDRREKEACLEQAADKHLKQRFERDYEAYKKSFQRESEKLGFKYFLNNKGLACESVKHAPPLVDKKEEVYSVICSSGESYQMQFDYESKQWNLKG